MMLWGIFSALAVAAALFMVLPLFGAKTRIANRQAGSVSILADQLREVDADHERGLISAADAQAARVEIKRRLLALSRLPETKRMDGIKSGRALLVVVALAVPATAGALYASLGSPQMSSMTFADREDERTQRVEITDLTERLLERLKNDPNGGPTEGWMLLAQTYMRMERYSDAAAAIANVTERKDVTSAILSQYAEALIVAEGGIVTPDARTVIARARQMDPANPAASYYEAIALDQAGDGEEAHDLLLARLNGATGSESWVELFVAQANRIGETLGRDVVRPAPIAPMDAAPSSGPTEDDMAAAAEMSQSERDTFIRSMVDRLADRLENTPDDLDGWLRLAGAYQVLGDTQKAQVAYHQAERLAQTLPDDDPRRQTIREALTGLEQ
ncbi:MULTISPECIES: c-type cytochrome biogenesis protein CcmI [Rhodobacterales]|nr:MULTISPECIES: c-type cytochrome biogenesis protein CcmI [Rhodobacterales]